MGKADAQRAVKVDIESISTEYRLNIDSISILLLAARLPYPPERTVVRVVDALVKLAGPLPRCSVCEHSHTTACCGHIAAAPLQLSREESTAGVCVARVRVSTARLPAEQI